MNYLRLGHSLRCLNHSGKKWANAVMLYLQYYIHVIFRRKNAKPIITSLHLWHKMLNCCQDQLWVSQWRVNGTAGSLYGQREPRVWLAGRAAPLGSRSPWLPQPLHSFPPRGSYMFTRTSRVTYPPSRPGAREVGIGTEWTIGWRCGERVNNTAMAESHAYYGLLRLAGQGGTHWLKPRLDYFISESVTRQKLQHRGRFPWKWTVSGFALHPETLY